MHLRTDCPNKPPSRSGTKAWNAGGPGATRAHPFGYLTSRWLPTEGVRLPAAAQEYARVERVHPKSVHVQTKMNGTIKKREVTDYAAEREKPLAAANFVRDLNLRVIQAQIPTGLTARSSNIQL